MKQYLKFRSVYGESFSEIERITHTLESDGITPVSVLDYEGKPIMTRGNISMITGLSKIENSSFVKALAVSYFKGESIIKSLGYFPEWTILEEADPLNNIGLN